MSDESTVLLQIVPNEKWITTKKVETSPDSITKYTVKTLVKNMSNTVPPEYTKFKSADELRTYISNNSNIYVIKTNTQGTTTTQVDNDNVDSIVDNLNLLFDPTPQTGRFESIKNELGKQSNQISRWLRNPLSESTGGKTRRKRSSYKKSYKKSARRNLTRRS